MAGHAANFVNVEIENAAVFRPCDAEHAVRALSELKLEVVRRTAFIARYARASIMSEMALDIARLLPVDGLEKPGMSSSNNDPRTRPSGAFQLPETR